MDLALWSDVHTTDDVLPEDESPDAYQPMDQFRSEDSS
jgi:hypothetical protein